MILRLCILDHAIARAILHKICFLQTKKHLAFRLSSICVVLICAEVETLQAYFFA
ncbi:MAG: hypothetical protein R3Y12_05830 [Clostridia bacterium]